MYAIYFGTFDFQGLEVDLGLFGAHFKIFLYQIKNINYILMRCEPKAWSYLANGQVECHGHWTSLVLLFFLSQPWKHALMSDVWKELNMVHLK